jgi:PAS domain S-box-containing protein
LRESEERFELAIRGTDAGIWDWDLRTNEVYYSPRWRSMLGYAQDEVAGDYVEWESRLHPEDRERALGAIRDYLEGTSSEYELEHRLRHKDGSYRWILARGAAVRDKDGKPYRVVGSHLDITGRKRSEQRLREREAQLVAAQRIQEHLLPPSSPVVPGFDITGKVLPAEFAGGDYFDYLCLPDGSLGVVVGDVSGHGVSSALLTASTCAHLRSFVADHTDVQEVLAHTNSILCWETEEGRFVTLLFARLDLKSRTVHYVNAGHPSGYVLSQSGDVKAVLESGTLPLAVLPDAEFPVGGPIGLEPNDILLLVTDGIPEARSPEDVLFGAERMLDIVRAHRNRKSSEIIAALHRAVHDFTQRAQQIDDLTAVVVKVEASSESCDV